MCEDQIGGGRARTPGSEGSLCAGRAHMCVELRVRDFSLFSFRCVTLFGLQIQKEQTSFISSGVYPRSIASAHPRTGYKCKFLESI